MKLDLKRPTLDLKKPVLNLKQRPFQPPYKMEDGEYKRKRLARSKALAKKMV